MDRIDLYLQQNIPSTYVNTESENILLNKFVTLYDIAKAAKENHSECNPANLAMWRKAYEGTLNAIDIETGKESSEKSRQIRKMAFELVESIIDNSVPMPKIQPRYKRDLPLVDVTENYLKFEADRILTKYVNDRCERATYVDGTSWYKIWWDSLDRTHNRSGDVKIDICTVDQITPQPGVTDYKQLEYIFEEQQLSIAKIYDLYGRLMLPIDKSTPVIPVINCYYLNEHRIVGRFSWAYASRQVICHEKDWQIRKIRYCRKCQTIVPDDEICPVCGSKSFKFKNAEEDILTEDIYDIYNPYEAGETNDDQKTVDKRIFAKAGTTLPFYRVDQLPFVPRPAVSKVNSIYGMSTVKIYLEAQDAINKVLTKAVDKQLKSGGLITKPDKLKIADTNETIKVLGVKTSEESAMVQFKEFVADTSRDLILANNIYDIGKAASGVTNSFQGQRDTTATSGVAKEYAALQSAGRIESMRTMKVAAFSGVYELILKYLLAFSDEPRKFVKVLPDGATEEATWSKYLFLDKDKYGQFYYRDDFHFDCDTASSLSENRTQMWQETTNKFVQGAFGVPNDPRVLKLYWNIMDSLQYPLAKIVLAGINDNEKHIPPDIEQAIMNNPEVLSQVIQVLQNSQTGGQGGARPNSGPEGNGATQAANVERTNERNRAENADTSGLTAAKNALGGNV